MMPRDRSLIEWVTLLSLEHEVAFEVDSHKRYPEIDGRMARRGTESVDLCPS